MGCDTRGIYRRGNDHVIVARIEELSLATGLPEQAEGLVLTGHFALTEDGPALAGTSVLLIARTDPGYDNEYAGVVPAAAGDAATAGLGLIWEVVTGPGLLRSRQLLVVGPGAP